jgi:hypothetical protein
LVKALIVRHKISNFIKKIVILSRDPIPLIDISSLAIAEREGEEDSIFSFTASPVQSQVSIGSKEN